MPAELTARERTILGAIMKSDQIAGDEAVIDCGVDEHALMALSLTEDIELDSLEIVAMTVELEDEFSIEIADAEIDDLKTIGDCVRLIERKAPGHG